MSRLTDRIDDACDEFEEEWKGGCERPRIGDYLARYPGLAGRAFFVELLKLDLDFRRTRGEDPRPQAYADRFPMYIPEIRIGFGLAESEVESPTGGSIELSSTREGAWAMFTLPGTWSLAARSPSRSYRGDTPTIRAAGPVSPGKRRPRTS